MYIEVPFLFASAQTIQYLNVTSSEMSIERKMSFAFVLILSLGFKFLKNTEILGNLNVPFCVSYNT
jgi:hypothetical protein